MMREQLPIYVTVGYKVFASQGNVIVQQGHFDKHRTIQFIDSKNICHIYRLIQLESDIIATKIPESIGGKDKTLFKERAIVNIFDDADNATATVQSMNNHVQGILGFIVDEEKFVIPMIGNVIDIELDRIKYIDIEYNHMMYFNDNITPQSKDIFQLGDIDISRCFVDCIFNVYLN